MREAETKSNEVDLTHSSSGDRYGKEGGGRENKVRLTDWGGEGE